MARQTPETLLISAILTAQDPTAHQQYGLASVHLHGYRQEFDWIMSYVERFHQCPTKSEFMAAFPDFPLSDEVDDVRWVAEEITRAYSSRQMAKALVNASSLLKAGEVEQAYEVFNDLTYVRPVTKAEDLLLDPTFLDDYDRPDDRLHMPWKTVQRHTDGMGRGEFWVFAARPTQGKTHMMMEIAIDAVLRGERVCLYSLEMTKRQMQTLVHTTIAHKLGIKVSHHELHTRTFDKLAYKRLLEQIADQVPGTIAVHTPADGIATPSVVAARADDYDLTVIDHIGLMPTDTYQQSVEDWRVAAAISNQIKRVALAKNARILAASQINRDGDSAFGRPPKLKNLTGTDALAQDADVVITMARYGRGATHLSLEKNRYGDSEVSFFTRFDADTGDFREIDRDKADEIRDSEDDYK